MELKEIAENIEYNTGLDVKPSHIKTSENWVFLYRKDLFDSYQKIVLKLRNSM